MEKAVVIALAWGSSLALAVTYLFVGSGIDRLLSGDAPFAAFTVALAGAVVSGVLAHQVGIACTRALVTHEPARRHDMLDHVFALGPAERTRERSGRLVNTMTDGVERNAMHTSSFVAPMAASLLTPALIVLIVAITVDWVSALLLAISIPLVPACVLGFQAAFKTVSKKYRTASRALAAQELDAIQGLSTLVRMNAGKTMGRTLAGAAEEVRIRVMRYLAGNQLVLFAVDSVFSLGMITAAVALALWRFDAGAITAGQALSLVLLSSIMLDPLDRIGQFFYIGMGGMAAGREMKRFLSEVPAALDAPGAEAPTSIPSPGSVAVEDVHFAWDPAVPVLSGASLEVRAGEHVVLTGASGAGKSTLSSLIQGHQRPTQGRILIEGVDMATAPLDWVRSRIAVVEQSTYLFTGTLRDNLLLARPDATDEEILHALQRAHLTDLLERLPEGLDTPVGQRGLALSGGEGQRLAIARALLKDAPIMLLDEPTAHVDLASEKAILDTLNDVAGERTTITISHRGATIARADRRADLVEGQIR